MAKDSARQKIVVINLRSFARERLRGTRLTKNAPSFSARISFGGKERGRSVTERQAARHAAFPPCYNQNNSEKNGGRAMDKMLRRTTLVCSLGVASVFAGSGAALLAALVVYKEVQK